MVAEVDQSQGITVEVEIDSNGRSVFQYRILLFANKSPKHNKNYGRVVVTLSRNRLHVAQTETNATARKIYVENIESMGAADEPLRGTFRVACDPKTGVLMAWFNGELIGKGRVGGLRRGRGRPRKDGGRSPKLGRYVWITHYRPLRTRCARVLPLFVPPDVSTVPPVPAQNAFKVFLANGDGFDARSVTMAGGSLTTVTAGGERRLPLADVARLAFPVAPHKASAPSTGSGRAGLVNVDMTDGSLALKPARMTATHLLGASPVLGPVRIRRAAIQNLRAGGSSRGVAGPDVVNLADGRGFSCRVLGVDDRRRLHFRAPWLDGEGVLRGDVPMELRLAGMPPGERSPNTAVLTNGDVLTGKMLELTEDELDFQSDLFGDHTLASSIVAAITHAGGLPKGIGDMTVFSPGRLGSWKPHVGKWAVENKWLTAAPPWNPASFLPGRSALATKVDQSQGITVEVEMDAAGAKDFRYDIILFADALRGQWGAESIRVTLVTEVEGTNLHVVRHRGLSEFEMVLAKLKGLGTPAKPLKGTFRAAFDPKSAVLAVWFNSELIGKCTMDRLPEGGGHYVMISHHKPVRTRRAWILPKFAPATPIALQDRGQKVFRMLLANGDAFDPSAVTMSDGRVTAMTPDGEMRLPLANVVQFTFPTATRKAPPGAGHNAIVQTGRGRLTFKLTVLTAEHAIGHSDLLGTVKIPRKLVHSLKFPQRAVAVPSK